MLCLLIAVVSISAFITALILIIALAKSDGDLLLMFKAKYGKQPDSLVGKVVWITGASSGIGEHIAYCLARAGCRLVLSARRKVELEKVKQKCLLTSKGNVSEDDILVLPLNVIEYETHKPAVLRVIEHFSKIDILVNNAGKSQRAQWKDVQLSVDRELFEINVLGQVSLTQEVLPHMMDRKQGHIVVMSSLAGKIGAPNSRSYTGSKHALQGYFECLRTEIGEYNIDITLICPGPVHSNLFIEAATAQHGETLGRSDNSKAKKMETDRCAYLSCIAIANKLYETWICQQPSLAMVYLNLFFPILSHWLLKKIGVSRLMKMREGQ